MMTLPKPINPIGFGRPKPATSTTHRHESSPTTYLSVKGLVETSESKPQPSLPLPASIYELNDILHHTRLLIDLYKSKHPDPESHVDLCVLSRSRPLVYFLAFTNGEERRLLGQLAELGQELHELRLQRQEDELAWLRHEALRGLPGKDQGASGATTSAAGYRTAETHLTASTYCTAKSHHSEGDSDADSAVDSGIDAIEPTDKEKANNLSAELDTDAVSPTKVEIEQMVDSEDERITSRFFINRPITTPNVRSGLSPPSSRMESFWKCMEAEGPLRPSESRPAATQAQVRPVAPLPRPIPRPAEAASPATVVSSNEADMSGFSFPSSRSIADSSIYRQQGLERGPVTEAQTSRPEHLPPRGPRQWLAIETANKQHEAAMTARRGVEQWLAAQAALQSRIRF